jgi:hypothetical protein
VSTGVKVALSSIGALLVGLFCFLIIIWMGATKRQGIVKRYPHPQQVAPARPQPRQVAPRTSPPGPAPLALLHAHRGGLS